MVGLLTIGAALAIVLYRGETPGSPPEPAAIRAPILTYHAISEPPVDARHRELFVPPEDFAAQMTWLFEQDFEAVTLDELHGALNDGSPLPPKPVVISFDDGLQTQFTEALPVLRDLDWPGVLNLKVESLRQGELTEAMVGRMIAAGWEVGSHTITHPKLTRLGRGTLEREVAGSRRILQRRLRTPVNFFSYPYGKLDPPVVEAVRDAGYLGATTTTRALASATADPYRLPRLRVEGSAGVEGFAAEINSAAAGR